MEGYYNLRQTLEWMVFGRTPYCEEYEILEERVLIKYLNSKNTEVDNIKDADLFQKLKIAEANLKYAIKNEKLGFLGKILTESRDAELYINAWFQKDNAFRISFPPFMGGKIYFVNNGIMEIYEDDDFLLSFTNIQFEVNELRNLFPEGWMLQNMDLYILPEKNSKKQHDQINEEIQKKAKDLKIKDPYITNNKAADIILKKLNIKPGQYPSKSQVINLISEIIPKRIRGKINK